MGTHFDKKFSTTHWVFKNFIEIDGNLSDEMKIIAKDKCFKIKSELYITAHLQKYVIVK